MKTLPTTIKGVATELLSKHPQLADRIRKAVDLVLRGGLSYHAHTEQGEPIYTARSSSEPGRVYTVMAGSCTCPARTLCYHRVARGIVVIRAANVTAVDFGEALSREGQETGGEGTTPSAAPSVAEQRSVFVEALERAPETPSKRVILAGVLRRGHLTIRASMAALGEHLRGAEFARPKTAKVH
jgi:hypothetical protein